MSPQQPATAGNAPEEAGRAGLYRLLARMLAAAPDAELLGVLKELGFAGSPLGERLSDLARRAAVVDENSAKSEYDALFIGMGRGELLPHASYYLTGFLNEKPLAKLRADLRTIGIGRNPANRVPEDHIAFLCDVMATLIEQETVGDPAIGADEFFKRHIGNWAPAFFGDLQRAQNADLYQSVGAIGQLFVAIEEEARDMAA